MKTGMYKYFLFPLKASLLLMLVFGILLLVLSLAATLVLNHEPAEEFFMLSLFEVMMMAGVMIYFRVRNLIKNRLSEINKIAGMIIPDVLLAFILIIIGMSLYVGYHIIHNIELNDIYDFFSITVIFVSSFAIFIILYTLVSATNHYIKRLNSFLKSIIATLIACVITFPMIELYKSKCCSFEEGRILYFFVFSFCFSIGISRFVILRAYFDKTIDKNTA